MSRRCEICGKTGAAGRRITRSGSPKYKGGIGLHTGGISLRRFNPNVQKIKIVVDGTVHRTRVCSRCLKAGKVQRPLARPNQLERSKAKEAARMAAEAEAARLKIEAQAAVESERAAAEAEEAAREVAEEAAYAERAAKRAHKGGPRRDRDGERPVETAKPKAAADETAPPAAEKPVDDKTED